MASNHVHTDEHHQAAGQQSSNMFANPDLNDYNAAFPLAHHPEQPYGAGWNYAQAAFDAPRNSNQVHPTWQAQHQSGLRPSTFDPNASNIYGRTFSNSPAPYNNTSFANHGNMPHHFQQQAVDPSLVSTSTPDNANFDMSMSPYATPGTQSSTVAPQALQSGQPAFSASASPAPGYQTQRPDGAPQQPGYSQGGPPAAAPLDKFNPPRAPSGVRSGNFIVTDMDALTAATNSRPFHNFLALGESSIEFNVAKSTIPQYTPRRSRNELRRLGASNPTLLAKIAKSSKKASKTATPKAPRPKASSGSARSPKMFKEEPTDSSSETESSSDDSDYESSEDEVPEPSPLPSARPQQPLPAVRYDIIKAAWRPKNKPVFAESIRAGLKDLWEVVRTIRDRWKMDQSAVKQAEEMKKEGELPLLKERVNNQREMMDTAIKSTLEYGHPDILRVLGGNMSFLFVSYQFLADRIKENEYNDGFSKTILELLSRCENITTEGLEKTKLDTALKRYLKRGDEKSKRIAQGIFDGAAAHSKERAEAAKVAKPEARKDPEAKPVEGQVKAESSVKTVPSSVAGVKRPLSGNAPSSQPLKKMSSSTVGTSAGAVSAKVAPSGLKRPTLAAAGVAKAAPSTAAAAGAAGKAKMVAKPSILAGLQSASKRPGASTAQKAVPAKKPAAHSAPKFSFAETMANLTKPKSPPPKAKAESKAPPETEEEKAKRLHKESRRHLRVRWKDNETADNELTSVRYFTHAPEEEIGHDESMVRDVSDVGGEGRMFKQHKDMMDVEDDDERQLEETRRPFFTPSLIDFSVVDKDERERNYEPFGGGVRKPDSPEKALQEQHESKTLLVVYTHPSDIPPCPKEPPQEEAAQAANLTPFGTPPDHILQRAASFTAPTAAPMPASGTSGPQDISALLSLLGSAQQQQQPQQQQQQPQSDLEKTFHMFANPAPQASAHQPQMTAPQHQQTQAAAPPVDLQTIKTINDLLGKIQPQSQPPPQQHQQHQQVQAQHMQQPPQQSAFTPMPGGFDLAGILQSVQNGASQAYPAYNYPQQPQMQQPALPSQQQHFDDERKRSREGGGDGRSGNFNKKKKYAGNREPRKFVLPCRYWQEGKCNKGAACTYLHE